MLQAQLQPWHDAVNEPAAAQDAVLHRLLRMHLAWSYASLGQEVQETSADLDPELTDQLEKLGYIIK